MAVAQNPKSGIVDVNDLRYVLRIFSKNWYFVVVAIVLSAILSYLYSYKIPEVYGASTRIMLKDRDVYNYQKDINKEIGYVAAYGDIMTQQRVLTSYDMIDRALSKLDYDVSYYIIGRFKTSEVYGSLPFKVSIDLLNAKLYERPFDLRLVDPDHYELSYDPGGGVTTKQYPFNTEVVEADFVLTVTKTGQLTAATIEKLSESAYQFVRHSRPWLVSKYAASISIENLDYTTILDIKAEDEIAERAKTFLDTLSVEYKVFNLRSEYEINEKTLSYIDKQLDEVTTILDVHEEELQHYMENKGILNLGREENRYFNEMVGYDNQRIGLDLQIQALEDLENYVLTLDESEKLLPPSLYVLDKDDYLEKTLNTLYNMQMERTRDLMDAKASNPGITRSDTTMQLVRANLLVYIKNSKQAMREKIASLDEKVAGFEDKIRLIPETQRDMLNIRRKVDVNERLYVFLLEKRANTVIAKAGIIPGTKVIEAARVIGVVRPDKLKILYTFVFGGVLLSLIVVFIRIMFYDRVENGDQLKAATHLAVFGEIIQSEKAQDNYVVVDSDPKSAITESFRTIRTNLEYLPLPDTGRVVMLTSYRPNEGKTFCSVNLSAILARAGKKVLLLELDLHKPKVAKALNMSTPTGLSAILSGKAEAADCIQHTQIENLDVVLSGPSPPNASELVLSKKMVELLDRGRAHFDYIIIDTPPVGLITDALVLMKHVDATLFVVNTRFANRDHIRSAMEAIAESKARNFGFILNGVRMKKSKYYYNTNYGYGYRYAYGYGSGYGYGYGYGYTGRRSKKGKDGKKEDDKRTELPG